MKKAYLSMSLSTPQTVISKLVDFILANFDVDSVDWHKKGTEYEVSKLLSSDIVFSYAPVNFIGKGQFSEVENSEQHSIPLIIIKGINSFVVFDSYNLLHYDRNNWKDKYGSFHDLKTTNHIPFVRTLSIKKKRNLLLLLID